MARIAIIGAGITGLTAAYTIKKKGIPIDLFEKNAIVGGVIQTLYQDGCLIELGPSTLQISDNRILNLLNEIDLDKDIIDSHSNAQKRYIVKNNKLVPLPNSLKSFITTPLFSAKAKLRLLKEPFIKKGSNPSETVAQFTIRRLGQEPLDYTIDPFVSGIYAGDPHKLSIQYAFPRLYNLERQFGSLFKGLLKKKKDPYKIRTRTVSFTNGMASLPIRLAEILKDSLYLNSKILSILQKKAGWEITWESDGKTQTQHYTKLIITIPASQLSTLPFEESLSKLFSSLNNINYAPLAVITQAFKPESIMHPLDGFGMLIPSKENFKTLGTLFTSTMFPGKTPKNFVTLRTFIGGSRHPNIEKLDKATIEGLVLEDLTSLLGIKDLPLYSHIHIWKSAIPQYNLGYEEFFHTMENVEKMFPGLHIMGNYRNGISLPQCILAGLNSSQFIQ